MAQQVARVAELERHVTSLRIGLLATVLVAGIGMWFTNRGPWRINVHTAPNLAPGAVTEVVGGVAPVPKPNVYGFAFYVWQQVNRWSKDGQKDYGAQIFAFQDYLTPRCREYLEQDMRAKAGAGELSGRSRATSELPGGAYSSARVVTEGTNAWTVYLDLSLTETMRGQVVKETAVRYPLRIVRYDVDLMRNQWQLAVDCSTNTVPQRLEIPQDAPSTGRRPFTTPSTAAPTDLPATAQILRPAASAPAASGVAP
jgi:integrating conjugative element protein (TIGR03746 family)